jgi:hypothetical protein
MASIKKKFSLALIGAGIGMIGEELISGRRLRSTIRKKEDDAGKLQEFYLILIQWLRVHQEGRTLTNYFIKNNLHTVAIYGMKELGEALLEELKNTDVEVKYAIDRDADNLYVEVDTYRPDEELGAVDVIVVTAVHYFDAIEESLKNKVDAKIVSLEDVVWEA